MHGPASRYAATPQARDPTTPTDPKQWITHRLTECLTDWTPGGGREGGEAAGRERERWWPDVLPGRPPQPQRQRRRQDVVGNAHAQPAQPSRHSVLYYYYYYYNHRHSTLLLQLPPGGEVPPIPIIHTPPPGCPMLMESLPSCEEAEEEGLAAGGIAATCIAERTTEEEEEAGGPGRSQDCSPTTDRGEGTVTAGLPDTLAEHWHQHDNNVWRKAVEAVEDAGNRYRSSIVLRDASQVAITWRGRMHGDHVWEDGTSYCTPLILPASFPGSSLPSRTLAS